METVFSHAAPYGHCSVFFFMGRVSVQINIASREASPKLTGDKIKGRSTMASCSIRGLHMFFVELYSHDEI